MWSFPFSWLVHLKSVNSSLHTRGPQYRQRRTILLYSRAGLLTQTIDGLRYAAGQNRYVYAMSAACRSSRGTLSALRQLPTHLLKFFRCTHSSTHARDTRNKPRGKPVIMKFAVHSHVRCLLSEKAHRYLNISRRFETTLPFYPVDKAMNEKTRVL